MGTKWACSVRVEVAIPAEYDWQFSDLKNVVVINFDIAESPPRSLEDGDSDSDDQYDSRVLKPKCSDSELLKRNTNNMMASCNDKQIHACGSNGSLTSL